MTILSQMNLRGNQTQKLVKTQIDSNFTTLANGVDAALTGQASGVAGYATKANLLADLSLPHMSPRTQHPPITARTGNQAPAVPERGCRAVSTG